MENEKFEQDEISLIDLFVVLFRYKWLIIGCTVFSAVFIVVLSIISLKLPPEKSFLPNMYKSEALMLIDDSSSQGGDLSSKLAASGLGGMASMLGFSNGGRASSYSKLAIFLSSTNSFLDAVIMEFDLIKRYKIDKYPKTNSRKALKERLEASFDDKSGVFSITYEDIDPEFAKSVVSYCVQYYENKFIELGVDRDLIEKNNIELAIENTMKEIENISQQIHQLDKRTSYAPVSDIIMQAEKLKMELSAQKTIYAQLKAKYELLKIKMKSDIPVIQILELPEISDQKSSPSRGKLCVIVTIASFFLSVFLAFFLNAVKNIKQDTMVMAKLRGESNEI